MGVEVVRAAVASLSDAPGVYRMIGSQGQALYVGKAKSLKKRVAAYTHPEKLTTRLQRMVRATVSMEFVTTHTEAEALLLEANIIKRLKPRYNISLRDDKSFPYIHIPAKHDFPMIVRRRGERTTDGEFFGPFASAGAVTEALATLQKAFLLRCCSDAVFANRRRPCLLYQIKRCSAPCVGRIGKAEYQACLDEARAFLSGGRHDVRNTLVRRMETHSRALEFEQAAVLRDRVKALTAIQARGGIELDTCEDLDVMAACAVGGLACVQVFLFRKGRNNGGRAYFPVHAQDAGNSEILGAFIGQFYVRRTPPPTILASASPPRLRLIEEALKRRAGHAVEVRLPQRGIKAKVVAHAVANAREALDRRLAETSAQKTLLREMAKMFELPRIPKRVEVYDNSHIQGSHAVGGMVVAGEEGFIRSAYRSFTIKDPAVIPGDDFAMMGEVLTRRFKRLLHEDPKRDTDQWPDVALIDGGAGQLSAATRALAELGISDVAVIAIAKGSNRTAGLERYYQPGREAITLPRNHPVHYFLQRLRDEAHRHAVGLHRGRRARALRGSVLDDLPGVGPKRKKALLHHFGSAKAAAAAGLGELEAVEGVSSALAKRLYNHFHHSQSC